MSRALVVTPAHQTNRFWETATQAGRLLMPATYKPVAGGYDWREYVSVLIRSERAEIDDIMALVAVANTNETHRVLASLLAKKNERLAVLYELLNMRDR